MRPKKSLTQDHYSITARSFFLRHEGSSRHRMRAKHGQEPRSGSCNVDVFRGPKTRHIETCLSVCFDCFKALMVFSPDVEIVSRSRNVTPRGLRLSRIRLPDHYQPIRVAVR